MRNTFGAMVEAGEIATGLAGRRRAGRRHPPAVRRRHLRPRHRLRGARAHPGRRAAIAELVRVLRPGGTMAVTVPTWLPEKICWMLSDEYHAPFVGAATCASTARPSCAAKLRARRRRAHRPSTTPTRCTRRTGGCAARSGRRTTTTGPSAAYRQVLEWDIVKAPARHPLAERRAQPRARQEPRRLRDGSRRRDRPPAVPDIDGVLSADEVVETAADASPRCSSRPG